MTTVYRILVVDDSPDNLFLIQNILDDQNLEIKTTKNGESAIRMIEEEPLQLILLDVMLPDTDGLEICKQVRSAGIITPILMLTAMLPVYRPSF